MRFLVDRCAGKRLADWLRSAGHDVIEARELGPDPGDSALLEQAATEGRILVTIDTETSERLSACTALHTRVSSDFQTCQQNAALLWLPI